MSRSRKKKRITKKSGNIMERKDILVGLLSNVAAALIADFIRWLVGLLFG